MQYRHRAILVLGKGILDVPQGVYSGFSLAKGTILRSTRIANYRNINRSWNSDYKYKEKDV